MHTARCSGFALSFVLQACSSDSQVAVPPAEIPGRSLAECSVGWQALLSYPAADSLPPRSIAFAGGEVIFHFSPSESGNEIRGFSPTRTPFSMRTIAAGYFTDVWADGDRLYYLQGDGPLYTVALGGGVPEVVLTSFAADRLLQAPLVAGGALHWGGLAPGQEKVGVWRQSLDAAEPTQLGQVDLEQIDDGNLVLSSAGVIVMDRHAPALVMPLDGGAPLPLAYPGDTESIGGGPTGVYWQRLIASDGAQRDELSFELYASPADGGEAAPFWPAKPAELRIGRLWEDGQGGFWVFGNAPYEDELEHHEVWHLDAEQEGQLLACDPSPHESGLPSVNAVAWSDSALYLISESPSLGQRGTWSLVQVPRDPSQSPSGT
jgi:hypothetical protein